MLQLGQPTTSLKIDSLKGDEKNKIESIREQFKLNQVPVRIQDDRIQRIEPYEMQEYRTRNVFSKSSDRVEIVLNNLHTPKKYSLIPLPRELRHLFPGFKVKFELETDVGVILTKITSGPGGTKYGDPVAGAYIQGGLKRWYDAHHELKNGTTLIISIIEPQKKYSLSIK